VEVRFPSLSLTCHTSGKCPFSTHADQNLRSSDLFIRPGFGLSDFKTGRDQCGEDLVGVAIVAVVAIGVPAVLPGDDARDDLAGRIIHRYRVS